MDYGLTICFIHMTARHIWRLQYMWRLQDVYGSWCNSIPFIHMTAKHIWRQQDIYGDCKTYMDHGVTLLFMWLTYMWYGTIRHLDKGILPSLSFTQPICMGCIRILGRAWQADMFALLWGSSMTDSFTIVAVSQVSVECVNGWDRGEGILLLWKVTWKNQPFKDIPHNPKSKTVSTF